MIKQILILTVLLLAVNSRSIRQNGRYDTKNNKHCSRYIHRYLCVQCKPGYYFNSTGYCERNYQFCANFNTQQQTCYQCQDGFHLYQPQYLCLPEIPNCSIYGQKFLCQKCERGFELNSKDLRKCDKVAIPSHLENCEEWSGDQCILCFENYYISGKTCKELSQNCLEYDSQNQLCAKCRFGYVGFNNDCELISEVLKSYGDNVFCQEFNGQECVKCMQGYFMKDSKCQHINYECQIVDQQAEKCKKCKEFWNIDQNGECW